jgi:hypothetical protein
LSNPQSRSTGAANVLKFGRIERERLSELKIRNLLWEGVPTEVGNLPFVHAARSRVVWRQGWCFFDHICG